MLKHTENPDRQQASVLVPGGSPCVGNRVVGFVGDHLDARAKLDTECLLQLRLVK